MKPQSHKVARNSLVNGVAFMINAVIGFLAVSLTVRLYGIEIQGLVAFGKLLTTAGYLSLFSLGLPGIMTRKLAHHQGRAEHEHSLDWIALGSRLAFVLGVILSFGLLALYASSSARHIFLETIGFSIVPEAEQAPLVLLLALTLPIQFVAMIHQAGLFGLQDFASIRSSEISSSVLNMIFLAVFWMAGIPGEKLILTVVISETIKSLFLIFRFHRKISISSWLWRKPAELRSEFKKEIKVSAGSSVMAFLDNTAAPYVAMRVLGAHGLGIYDSLTKLSRVVKTAFGLFNSSILPHAISVEAQRGEAQVSHLFKRASFMVAFFLAPGFGLLMGLSPWILKLWLGADFSSYWQELNLGYVTMFALIFIGLQGSIFSSRRETIAKMTWINFWENVIGLPLLYWMALSYGILGLFLNRLFVIWLGWIPRAGVVIKTYSFPVKTYVAAFRWSLPVGALLGGLVLCLSLTTLHPILVFTLGTLMLIPAWFLLYGASSDEERAVIQRMWKEIGILLRLKKRT